MRIKQLEQLIEQPKFHEALLHGFDRAYSLGIGRNPDEPSEYVVIVQIDGQEVPEIPTEIKVGDETVRVITKTGFRTPRPLTAHK